MVVQVMQQQRFVFILIISHLINAFRQSTNHIVRSLCVEIRKYLQKFTLLATMFSQHTPENSSGCSVYAWLDKISVSQKKD